MTVREMETVLFAAARVEIPRVDHSAILARLYAAAFAVAIVGASLLVIIGS